MSTSSGAREPGGVLSGLVLQWNHQVISVRCPWCDRAHVYGLGSGEPFVEKEICCEESGRNYRSRSILPVFPHGVAHGVGTCKDHGWELAKNGRAFVAVNKQGAATPSYYYDTPRYDPYHDEFSGRNRKKKWHGKLSSACKHADLEMLTELFNTHGSAVVEVQVGDAWNTGLILAAAAPHGLSTVEWLLQHGASINACNARGRTALMEAVLWCKLATVRRLLSSGAETATKDEEGRTALDLSLYSERNHHERLRRCREKTLSLDVFFRRKLVEQELRDHAKISSPESQSYLEQKEVLILDKEPDLNLKLFALETTMDLSPEDSGSPAKVFGSLDRGPMYPIVRALSGSTDLNQKGALNNRKWNRKARALQERLGMEINHITTSHVEQKLLAYLAEKHALDLGVEPHTARRPELAIARPQGMLEVQITLSIPEACESCKEMVCEFQRLYANLIEIDWMFMEVAGLADVMES